jgi:pyruvate dehydrogenase E2 component (dihydrolipoamide acetyltransferase)
VSEDIRIPDIGDADDVEVVEILASAGDEVGEDDPIIVIESDKASMEVPAGIAGKLDSIEVAIGDKVKEGQVIARVSPAGGGADDDGDREGDEAAGRDEAADQGAASDRDEKTDQSEETDQDEEEKRQEQPDRNDDSGAGSSSETVEVRVPDIGEADNVEVIEVAVKAGDQVGENDLLVVVESDKASMEIPAGHSGKVVDVHVSEGSAVEEGSLLVTLEVAGRARKADKAPERKAPEGKKPEPKREEKKREEKKTPDSSEHDDGDEAKAEASAPKPETGGAEIYAGPAARRLARELGVDLRAVEGTGNRGRIVKDDIKAHVKTRMTGGGPVGAGLPAVPEIDFSKFGEVETQALSRIRARGAENLHRSWVNLPHVTQHDEVDVTELEAFRASLKAESEERGVKLTPLAFIIKACCQVLAEFPTFNASLDAAAKNFILKRYYHIGMAVDTPDGLVVPVIRDADRKGVWELSAEIIELADKARNKKLGVADLQGGSFSVTSLGPIGGTGFTPIINAPEVAILGISRVTMRPRWNGSEFVPRKMLPLSLSYDHRAINGAEAGRFMVRLGELLTDIRRMVL